MHPHGMNRRSWIVLLFAAVIAAVPAHAQDITVEPPQLDFGRITVGGDACLSVIVYNRSTVPLALLAVNNPAAPFPTAFPDTIPPGIGTFIEFCFAARHLGPDSARITIVYDAGRRDSLVLPATAFGWDSLALGIGTTVIGRPGSVVDIPIRVFGDIPASYDLREYVFTMQFNKTMLYPLTDVRHGATLTAGMTEPALDLTRDFSTSPAQAVYRVRGASPLVNPAADSILVNARFLVLHGNAMASDLTLLSARFGRDLPRLGVFLKGRFVTDSLCFQDLRLVEIPDRDGETVLGGYPNPFSDGTLVHVQLPEEASIHLAVHDMLGRRVAQLADGWRPKGTHVFRFDAAGLPEGTYLCVLRSGAAVRLYPVRHVR